MTAKTDKPRRPRPLYLKCHGGPLKHLRYDHLPNGKLCTVDEVVPLTSGGRYVRIYQPESDGYEFVYEGE